MDQFSRPLIVKIPFRRISDVGIDQQTVHFRVDIFHCNLEAIEASCFWDLHLLRESFNLNSKIHSSVNRVNLPAKTRFLNMREQFTKFSLTMPSLAAKNASIAEMKLFSSGFKQFH
jgi:hypothetical protein